MIFFYRTYSLQRISRTEQYFKSLPPHHQKLMESYLQHLNNIKNCIEANDYIVKLIIMDVEYMFQNVHLIDHEHSQPVSFQLCVRNPLT